MGARALVLQAVAAALSHDPQLGPLTPAGTAPRRNLVHEILGPLAAGVPEPQYSWLLLCSGDVTRLRTVAHALHDLALARWPRGNADRLYRLCMAVALDCSRSEALRVPLPSEQRRAREAQGEPVPTADPWGGPRLARWLGISDKTYYAHYRDKRQALEDILTVWSGAWQQAAVILRRQGWLD